MPVYRISFTITNYSGYDPGGKFKCFCSLVVLILLRIRMHAHLRLI